MESEDSHSGWVNEPPPAGPSWPEQPLPHHPQAAQVPPGGRSAPGRASVPPPAPSQTGPAPTGPQRSGPPPAAGSARPVQPASQGRAVVPPAAGATGTTYPSAQYPTVTPTPPPNSGSGRATVQSVPPSENGSGRASVPSMRSPEDGKSGRTAVPPNLPAPPAPPAANPPDPVTPPPAGPARRRTGLLVGLTAVVAVALAAAGVVVVKPGPVAGWMGGAEPTPSIAADPPEPPPGAVLAAVGNGAPTPTPDGLRTVLDPLVGADVLGPSVHVAVLDVATRELLYGQGPETPTVPASTTKLITAATVLSARGPAYRIATRVVAGTAPGEVVLVGGGDPTLAINATGIYPGAGRLDQLAAQVKQALGGVAPTKVTVDSSLFPKPVYGPGWDADIPTGGFAGPITALMTDGGRVDPKDNVKGAERYANPDIAAGRALARALGLPTAAVNAVARGTAPPDTAAPPAGSEATPGTDQASPGTDQASPGTGPAGPGTELGRVESPPMGRLVEFMLADSDNVVAEALARQVALARNQPASFDGAAAAMDAVVAELKLPADQSTLSDGSGLSRNNRISPELLTDVLALAADGTRPELAGIFAGLPVAGWSGTLTERFEGQDAGAAIGVVRAKTGTLTGVHAIAGVVTTAQGRLLAFSVLADQVPVGLEQAQPPLDRIAAALASCGCGS